MTSSVDALTAAQDAYYVQHELSGKQSTQRLEQSESSELGLVKPACARKKHLVCLWSLHHRMCPNLMHTVTASLSRVGKAGCIIQPNATACSSANQTNVSTHGCTMLSYDAHIAIQGYMHSYSNIKALNGLMLLCWLQLTVLDLSQSSIYGSLPDAWSQLTKVSSVLFKIECLCVNHSLTGQRLCKPGFCKPDTLKDLILDAAVFLFKPAIVLVQASHGVHMLS